MKINNAISIRQPWLWLIMNGYKDVEIRMWKPKTLDDEFIALHASKTFDQESYEYLRDEVKIRKIPDEFPNLGKLIGIAKIDGVIPFTDKNDFYLYRWRHLNDPGWWKSKCYGWVLSDVREIEHVEWKGKLGLFYVEVEI